MPTYTTLEGEPVNIAGSMAGANRGDYVLDEHTDQPVSRSVDELINRWGVWRRAQLIEHRKDLYETTTRVMSAWRRQ